MSFGSTLRQHRLAMGWTQQQLGDLIGKTKNNISQYELDKREPDLSQLRYLARLFGVSVDELLGGQRGRDVSKGNTLREDASLPYENVPVLLPIYDHLPLGASIDMRFAQAKQGANQYFFIAPEDFGRIRRGDMLLVEAADFLSGEPLLLLEYKKKAVLRTVKPCEGGLLWLLPGGCKESPEMVKRADVTCHGRVLRVEFTLEDGV